MACIPAAARKQASSHLVVGPVVQDGCVSRSAMRLAWASTTFWYHTKHCCCLTDETCAESSKMSLVAWRVECMTDKEPRIEDAEGELSPSQKTGGWPVTVPEKCATAHVQSTTLETVSGDTEGAVNLKVRAVDVHSFSALFLDIK